MGRRLQATRQYREGSHTPRRVTSRASSPGPILRLSLSPPNPLHSLPPTRLHLFDYSTMPAKEELLTQAKSADPKRAEALYREILGEHEEMDGSSR